MDRCSLYDNWCSLWSGAVRMITGVAYGAVQFVWSGSVCMITGVAYGAVQFV